MTCRFRTYPKHANVQPGRCFKVAVDNISYRRGRNGAVDASGALLTPDQFTDGDYPALVWHLGTPEAVEEVVTVHNGATNITNALFTTRDVVTRVMTFKTSRVSLNEDAEVEIEGVSFPTDDRGFSLFADGFDDPGRWVIEGAI